jgi:hypothetical protein
MLRSLSRDRECRRSDSLCSLQYRKATVRLRERQITRKRGTRANRHPEILKFRESGSAFRVSCRTSASARLSTGIATWTENGLPVEVVLSQHWTSRKQDCKLPAS